MLVAGGKNGGIYTEAHRVNYSLWVKQQKNVKFRHGLCCLLRKNL